MTEHDPLELELSSLRPHRLSVNTRNRIAERLSTSPPGKPRSVWTSTWLRGALVTGTLAASTAAIVLWRGETSPIQPNERMEQLELELSAAFDQSLPTVWSYQRALMRSPQAIEGLLDAHSIRSLQPRRDSTPPVVLARFVFRTDSLIGEL
jgi:hypothetical protein